MVTFIARKIAARCKPAPWMVSMQRKLVGLIAAISIVPAAANAQVNVEMDQVTCGQYLAMPPSQSANFSAWVSGWFSHQNGRTFVDLVLLGRNIANVQEWCRFHPDESVMSALQKTVDTQ